MYLVSDIFRMILRRFQLPLLLVVPLLFVYYYCYHHYRHHHIIIVVIIIIIVIIINQCYNGYSPCGVVFFAVQKLRTKAYITSRTAKENSGHTRHLNRFLLANSYSTDRVIGSTKKFCV
jgi:small-conductance mechanosensitive channel